MFEFAVRTTIARFDLSTAEGRVQGMRAAAPIVASIRDTSMRPEYTRTVAGWIGVEVEQVQAEVARAGRMAAREAKGEGPGQGSQHRVDTEAVPEPSAEEVRSAFPPPDLRDPVVFAERQLLQCLLQFPTCYDAAEVDAIAVESFSAPAHRAVFDGVRAAGGIQPALSAKAWADKVAEAAPLAVRGLVSELAVAPLPTRFDKATGLPERRYTQALLVRVQEVALTRRIADAMSAMRRMAADPHADPVRSRALSGELQDLQRELATLRDGAG
jgi:DNA primase